MAVKDPVNLDRALASFDDVYSPRIVTRVNDYDVRIAHVAGEHVWHVHDDTDEFFLVLDGRFDVALARRRGCRADGGAARAATRSWCLGGPSTSRRRPAARS